jgi:hypothetical protein
MGVTPLRVEEVAELYNGLTGRSGNGFCRFAFGSPVPKEQIKQELMNYARNKNTPWRVAEAIFLAPLDLMLKGMPR